MTHEKMPEALRLAEILLSGVAMIPEIDLPEAAEELRRQHAEIERLRAEVEGLRKDGERLIYATKDYDGFVNVKKDKWDYALECAIENNREPTCEDELNGVRRLIDAALQSTKEQSNG